MVIGITEDRLRAFIGDSELDPALQARSANYEILPLEEVLSPDDPSTRSGLKHTVSLHLQDLSTGQILRFLRVNSGHTITERAKAANVPESFVHMAEETFEFKDMVRSERFLSRIVQVLAARQAENESFVGLTDKVIQALLTSETSQIEMMLRRWRLVHGFEKFEECTELTTNVWGERRKHQRFLPFSDLLTKGQALGEIPTTDFWNNTTFSNAVNAWVHDANNRGILKPVAQLHAYLSAAGNATTARSLYEMLDLPIDQSQRLASYQPIALQHLQPLLEKAGIPSDLQASIRDGWPAEQLQKDNFHQRMLSLMFKEGISRSDLGRGLGIGGSRPDLDVLYALEGRSDFGQVSAAVLVYTLAPVEEMASLLQLKRDLLIARQLRTGGCQSDLFVTRLLHSVSAEEIYNAFGIPNDQLLAADGNVNSKYFENVSRAVTQQAAANDRKLLENWLRYREAPNDIRRMLFEIRPLLHMTPLPLSAALPSLSDTKAMVEKTSRRWDCRFEVSWRDCAAQDAALISSYPLTRMVHVLQAEEGGKEDFLRSRRMPPQKWGSIEKCLLAYGVCNEEQLVETLEGNSTALTSSRKLYIKTISNQVCTSIQEALEQMFCGRKNTSLSSCMQKLRALPERELEAAFYGYALNEMTFEQLIARRNLCSTQKAFHTQGRNEFPQYQNHETAAFLMHSLPGVTRYELINFISSRRVS